jgi:glycosyltransferase involved in cell wall biosynthesis
MSLPQTKVVSLDPDEGKEIYASITEPYLLIVSVPIKIDEDGVRWCNELWAKDLALHLEYISNLMVACPRIYAKPAERDVPLNVPPFDRVEFIEFEAPKSHREAIKLFPEFLWNMWRAIRKANIVHTGFGGWPVGEGWLAVPIGKVQRKFVLTNIESSFWRVQGADTKWRQRFRGIVAEYLTRFCVNLADLRLFTSKAYSEEFLKPNAERAYVLPATWIDEEIILTKAQANAIWASKTGHIRLLYAGTLAPIKGVKLLIEAVRQLGREHIEIVITIIGDGPLRRECTELARDTSTGTARVVMLDPVKYGEPFFDLLRHYDALLAPSLSDEQPRVIFDAFSQAVPVLGSDTGGIREVVDHLLNGQLFPPGDVNSLARALVWASHNRQTLQAMGMHALEKIHRFTHRSMHESRHGLLLKALNAEQQIST